ncbi:MAG: anaerobic ribonucleoside-triphosphate reductase activating protein [Candidatus Aenigmatarchaeota archaeon]
MKIGGLQKFTVTDYPGKISCIVFTIGCNFRCPFCQNSQLVTEEANEMPADKVFNFLEERPGQLEAVTVTGGEPLIQRNLFEFFGKVKDLGYDIKLDTNGSVPGELKRAVRKDLVDYVAMDIKAPIDEYEKACGIKVNTDEIEESIDFILGLDDYEFRTTAVPTIIDEKTIEEIAKRIEGAKKFYIQQFETKNTLDEDYQELESLPEKRLENFKEIAERYVQSCQIRNV